MEFTQSERLICGDIGGTNTRFALYEISPSGDCTEVFQQKYQNEHFHSFLEVLKNFLFNDAKTNDKLPVVGCFAVAGPVQENKVKFTNRGEWTIDGDEIAKTLGIRKISLVNDFLAVGYGLLTLDEEKECIVLQAGKKNKNAPIACIGAGTGLGECFLTPTSNGEYHCFPTEGGHAEFAPRNDLEVELLNFMKKKFEQKHRVSVERVISGPGLANVYEFLCHKFPEKADPHINEQVKNAGDLKGAIIASNTSNELCNLTMEIFTSAYGAEAGVAGLKWLPYGGLYLTGGLTPKNIDWITGKDGLFMKAFLDKGRVSGMLHPIPVYAVMIENVGERGALYLARKYYNETK